MSGYSKGYAAYEEGYPSTHWFYDLPPGTDGFSEDVAEWHRGWRDAEEVARNLQSHRSSKIYE